MTKLLFPLILLLATVIPAVAQKNTSGTVKGRIADTVGKQILSEASVSIMDLKDSSTVSFTVTNNKGAFEVIALDPGTYRLLITFQGYAQVNKNFTITNEKKLVDFGTIYMDKASVMLQEVIVERPPISIKKDTVEYNASSFKTKPNATVEDLLKKLPGVQVEKDGTVKAQGEQVQKVYVDGKEFFGTDPKLATKNLTADMVESVQVYDDMSDQAKFTRIDDGSRQKAINIKLKKDKKHGYFGRATVGAGTEGRYDGSLSFNRFKGTTQVSVLAGANNVNKQGFSFSDIISSMGGMGAMMGGGGGGGGMSNFGGGQMMAVNRTGGVNSGLGAFGFGGGSNGITRSWNAGINYRDVWGVKTDVSGSYFFSDSKTKTDQNSYRQSFFGNDSTTFTDQLTNATNENQNHRFNFRLEYKIDSLNSILYTPSFTMQHSESFGYDSSFTNYQKGKGPLTPGLKNIRRTSNERDGVNLNNNLLYRRRLNRIGRTFTLGWTNTYNNSEGDGLNYAPITFYKADGTPLNTITQDQQTDQQTRGNTNTVSTSYTEPLSHNKLLEVNYAYSNNQSTSDKETKDFNPVTGKYDVLNKILSNHFENSFISNRVGTNFRVQAKKYNFQLGGAAQFSTQETFSKRNVNGKDTVINTKQHFTNFFPAANFNYNYSRSKTLRLNYRGRTNAPTVTQLQDVPDVSNPLERRIGNPNLRQEFTHNLNASLNQFNFITFKYFAINLNASTTTNKIVNSIDTLAAIKGVQEIKPVNLDGAYTLSAFITNGIPLRNKKFKGTNINLTTAIIQNNDVSLLNKQKNKTTTWILTQSAGINYNYKERFDAGINGSLTYNSVRYAIGQTPNTEYFTQTYSVDFTYSPKSGFVFATDLDYFVNTGRSAGYNQTLPMWNASIAKQVFKKKNGEFKISVVDILNQNKSVNRNVGDNYIIDTRTNVLQRYFLLSFMYNLNKGGGPQMKLPGLFRRSVDNIRIN